MTKPDTTTPADLWRIKQGTQQQYLLGIKNKRKATAEEDAEFRLRHGFRPKGNGETPD